MEWEKFAFIGFVTMIVFYNVTLNMSGLSEVMQNQVMGIFYLNIVVMPIATFLLWYLDKKEAKT